MRNLRGVCLLPTNNKHNTLCCLSEVDLDKVFSNLKAPIYSLNICFKLSGKLHFSLALLVKETQPFEHDDCRPNVAWNISLFNEFEKSYQKYITSRA